MEAKDRKRNRASDKAQRRVGVVQAAVGARAKRVDHAYRRLEAVLRTAKFDEEYLDIIP